MGVNDTAESAFVFDLRFDSESMGAFQNFKINAVGPEVLVFLSEG